MQARTEKETEKRIVSEESFGRGDGAGMVCSKAGSTFYTQARC